MTAGRSLRTDSYLSGRQGDVVGNHDELPFRADLVIGAEGLQGLAREVHEGLGLDQEDLLPGND